MFPRLSPRNHRIGGALMVFVLAFMVVTVSLSNVHAQTSTQLWSNPATWGGRLPDANTDVMIRAGMNVVLDVPSVTVRTIMIDTGGSLSFGNTDVSLTANYIMIHGSLTVGTETSPYMRRAVITLSGNDPSQNIMGMGTKGIMIHGGTVDLHGRPAGITWTRLNATAPRGATQITLAANTGWAVGDRIVIASTDYDQEQAEERTITAINGAIVTLDSPLNYMHFGEIQTYAGMQIDTRAEVGLLNRNLVIQGDAGSIQTQFGGHLMAMQGATLRISNVEFTRMGQLARSGRYPVHFHLLGSAPNSYVRDSSFHHNFNRALTIHGTDRLLIQGNVAYDTIGHMYFLEDGVERYNVFDRNLGLLVRRPQNPLIQSDVENNFGPSVFWISNPNNTFRGNAAAGSAGTGFWIDLAERPTGPSSNVNMNPTREAMGEFNNNTAHSNYSFGVFIEPYFPPANYILQNITVYKNRDHGLWVTGNGVLVGGGQIIFESPRIADNGSGAIMPGFGIIRNGLFVGETANIGNPRPGEATGTDGRSLPYPATPSTPIIGHRFYDGPVGVIDTTFVNFQPNSQRQAGGIGWRHDLVGGRYLVNYVYNVDFVNANQAYFPPVADTSKLTSPSLFFRDLDGSLGGNPGSVIGYNFPLVISPSSIARTEWGGSINNYSVAMMRIGCQAGSTCPTTIVRDDGASIYVTDDGRFNVAIGRYYTFYRNDRSCNFEVVLKHTIQGEWVRATFPYTCTINRVFNGQNMTPVNSLAELDASTNGNVYFYDTTNRLLHLKLVQPGNNEYVNSYSETFAAVVTVQGSGQNTIVPPPPAGQRPPGQPAGNPGESGNPVITPVVDTDRDGFTDDVDMCFYIAGRFNGCPDVDGDQVGETMDYCPLTPGTFFGCPFNPDDDDFDGVVNAQDLCPLEAGANNGCN
jgi:cell migration-inducing and hyaluronan-binding protein